MVQLRSTYDGFLGEAIGSLAAWLLIAFNVVLAIGLMLGLAPLFKPRNVLLYALTIALTWQALIATDLAIEPLGGTEQVGQGQKLNVAFIHTGLEEVLTDSIDDPVEDAKRTEIAGLTERYPAAADLTTLRGDIDANLRTDGSVDDAERESVLTLVDGVIAETEPHHDDKIREIALAVYRGAGRDPIRDLLGTGGTSG